MSKLTRTVLSLVLIAATVLTIGIIIAFLGVCLTPFLEYLIKDKPNVENLH